MTPDPIKKEFIHFQNSNRALAILPSAKNKAEDLVATLDIPACQALILILGTAEGPDEQLLPQLAPLYGRGIARAAREVNAIILDSGTKTGVISLMGEGVASYGYQSVLIGVAPKNKISYADNGAAGTPLEPNHSHFVLTEGAEWGSETPLLFNLARALINRQPAAAPEGKPEKQAPAPAPAPAPLPALAILAGGGPQARTEVLRAVRLNMPLVVIEGSGGLADEIASARRRQDKLAHDPLMAEVMADGEILLHPLSSPVKGIERLIGRQLGVDQVLRQAWETYADYDGSARYQQRRFDQLQLAILLVGVVGTALALFQQVHAPKVAATGSLQPLFWHLFDSRGRLTFTAPSGWWVLRQLLIIIPIVLLVLVTAANRFRQGTRWLLLRASAEAIRREIYLYRTRARAYRDKAEQRLSRKLEDITRKTMQAPVSSAAGKPAHQDRGFPPGRYVAPGQDDGVSHLSPDRYVEWRLNDQLSLFKRRSFRLERQLKWLYWLTYVIGGLGAYLAAVNQQVWIALTTTLVAATGAFLGYRQTESALLQYNQAGTDLANIKAWWHALSAGEQAQQQHIDALIGHTEKVLQAAYESGVPQLQDALADLRPEQEARYELEGPRSGAFPSPARPRGPYWPEEKQAAAGLVATHPYPAPAVTGLPAGAPAAEGILAKTLSPAASGNGSTTVPYPEEAGTKPLAPLPERENGSA
jgi:SLOG in TRPM, prokaryote/SMODS and SLOG-associating 2TM effector domain 1/Protein of unknown function (DUF4231)